MSLNQHLVLCSCSASLDRGKLLENGRDYSHGWVGSQDAKRSLGETSAALLAKRGRLEEAPVAQSS